MLLLELIMVDLSPISTVNLLIAISTFTLNHVTLVTQNLQLFLVSVWKWKEFVLRKVILYQKFIAPAQTQQQYSMHDQIVDL